MSDMEDVETSPVGWRPACPSCGRFIAAADVSVVVDVLTYPEVDVPRDVARCGRCGVVELAWRPTF